jgi:hypothetical protein
LLMPLLEPSLAQYAALDRAASFRASRASG